MSGVFEKQALRGVSKGIGQSEEGVLIKCKATINFNIKFSPLQWLVKVKELRIG